MCAQSQRRIAALLTLLTWSSVCSFAQSPTSPAVYGPAIETLERFIEHEMADKDLPALSIALVDDQRLVWGNVPANRVAEVMTSYSWARQRT